MNTLTVNTRISNTCRIIWNWNCVLRNFLVLTSGQQHVTGEPQVATGPKFGVYAEVKKLHRKWLQRKNFGQLCTFENYGFTYNYL